MDREAIHQDNLRQWREHLTEDHGLPGTPCETYCTMAGEATHVLIGVDANGEGPVMESEPGYVRAVCWCGRDGCRAYMWWAH